MYSSVLKWHQTYFIISIISSTIFISNVKRLPSLWNWCQTQREIYYSMYINIRMNLLKIIFFFLNLWFIVDIIGFIIPPLPEGGGGYTVLPLSVCSSFRASIRQSFRLSVQDIFVAFFSVTVDGRNLIFGHTHHIGIPYCG
jgi:hypothetical protein